MDTPTTSTLWSLRPAGEHAALRRVAQGAGFRLRVLPLQRLVARADAARLVAALAAPIRLYSSPAAVRFAALQAAGDLHREGIDLAVGSGTAAALRRAGVAAARSPARMDSEGVLAMAELQAIAGEAVGVITAPGGRGLLLPALRERGAEVRVAEVYQRADLRGGARRLAAFADDPGAVLVASSAEAFGLLETLLPDATSLRGRALRARPVVVSSERLGAQAGRAGFVRVVVADGPTPSALVAAASRVPPVQ
ncbi:uroporphyrinogen-III synthase [Silanimonas sp.]|uniref:uroporphyrinogen-III synthase n=1 Tax=Silanimonas sp. TaxID=1929290 RepID=UPI0037C9737C